MKTLNLKQGTPEWLKTRLKHYTASEAAAMLGVSQYMSRNELLRLKKTGIQHDVDDATQARFDAGHASESCARQIAERMIGEDLYNVTGTAEIDGIPLLASFDGLTLMEDVVWEHKLLNDNLRESLRQRTIPDQYHPQLEQQLMVSGANRALFMTSSGEEHYEVWYYPNTGLRKTIIDGWKQFMRDLETFVVEPDSVKPTGEGLTPLPSLQISLIGEVRKSNLSVYKKTAMAFIQNINTDLKTDEDFANAEVAIKFCSKAEKELDDAKKRALAQTSSIDELFKTVDFLRDELRKKRLFLSKLVKAEKENIKASIIYDARRQLHQHISELKVILPDDRHFADFVEAIKGKRSLKSMRNAVATELANAKISVDRLAGGIRKNMTYYEKYAGDFGFLFNDIQVLAENEHAAFCALVDTRIREYKDNEAARIEAERKRMQEEAERKAEAKRAKKEEGNVETITISSCEYDGLSERDPGLKINISRELIIDFVGTCAEQNKSPGAVVHELMTEYVLNNNSKTIEQ